MKPFQSFINDRIPRRAFLFMPFAFAGMAAFWTRKDRPVPDAAQNGSGADVLVVIFADNGERKATVRVKKVVMSEAEWQKQQSPQAFAVTRGKGTERAFTGRYWNNHEAGLYRCVCCGNALFRSQEKFESGTGWPSFCAPIAEENIRTVKDGSLFMERVEVLCRKCDAHLGHVFDDGPRPRTCGIA